MADYRADGVFADFTQITPELLAENHIKGILTDLDDTLVGHNIPAPTQALCAWLESLRRAGIRICILSNNRKRRVQPFAEKIGVGFFCNALKPRPYFYRKGLAVLNLREEECVVIGDQLYTDVKGAKQCGIRAYLVEPVGQDATLFIRLKRKFEKGKR